MTRSIALVLSLLLPIAGPLAAQVGTDASILGTVKDSSGGVVPGAEVTVKNLETGLTRAAVSDDNGHFEILALPRGTYSASVSLASFKTWRQQPIELTLGEQKRISPVLEVGTTTQEVSVEAGVELIQTEKASIEGVVEEKQIRDLPSLNRNPIALVNLVPGMRFEGIVGGSFAREHSVQGLGQRNNQTRFSVDGLDSNDPSSDRGIAFPNLDTVAQFSVLTSNFSAENGKNPIQVQLITKGGTNEFHGTLWEFHRNNALDARNAFGVTKPKLIQNQYGYSVGGPILRNRTFFFTSYEGTNVRNERIYNSATVSEAMIGGDFTSRTAPLRDPLLTGNCTAADRTACFPGNILPASRITPAAKFFSSHILRPNSSGNFFRANAPAPSDLQNSTVRADQQLTSNQRVYVRWTRIHSGAQNLLYRPEYNQTVDLTQHSAGLSYNWSVNAKTLVDLAGGFIYSDQSQASNGIGKENLTDQGGIRGFPTAGREEAIGLPTVNITGYPGANFGMPNNTPGFFGREDINAKAAMSLLRGSHSLSFGYEWNDRRTLTRHASANSRGTFTFNSQYTGDGFADFLLGYVQAALRNFPLKSFGIGHSPYSGLYVQDYWRVSPNLTVSAGLRWDYWHEKTQVRNNGATFLVELGKAAAGVTPDGRVDLTAQATAPFLAKATEGFWISADEAKIPRGLFQATGFFAPRLGLAWRPLGGDGLVVRGGYGIFPTSYDGNVVGSAIIGFPYWTAENQTFTASSRTRWETAFPAEPTTFVNPALTAVRYDVEPMLVHQWNLSVQKALPLLKSALTLSYVGNRGADLVTQLNHNEAPPGTYTQAQLRAAKPYPTLGPIRLYENVGRSWYHSMQTKLERRFTKGLSYTFSYVFARNLDEYGATQTDNPTPFAPAGYDRGRSQLENRHVGNGNVIWELPFGRGRTWGSQLHPVANAVLGDWEFSSIYSFVSGSPLTFLWPGATLGNGFNSRPDLVGDPRVEDPNVDRWYNTAAFARPAGTSFGNSSIGLIDGPGFHSWDTALLKNFAFGERRYVQFRWEMFNAPNHVNFNDPITNLNTATSGRITGAGPARQMQFGLKIVF